MVVKDLAELPSVAKISQGGRKMTTCLVFLTLVLLVHLDDGRKVRTRRPVWSAINELRRKVDLLNETMEKMNEPEMALRTFSVILPGKCEQASWCSQEGGMCHPKGKQPLGTFKVSEEKCNPSMECYCYRNNQGKVLLNSITVRMSDAFRTALMRAWSSLYEERGTFIIQEVCPAPLVYLTMPPQSTLTDRKEVEQDLMEG